MVEGAKQELLFLAAGSVTEKWTRKKSIALDAPGRGKVAFHLGEGRAGEEGCTRIERCCDSIATAIVTEPTSTILGRLYHWCGILETHNMEGWESRGKSMRVSENPHTSPTRTQTVRFIIRGDGGAREGE